MTNQNVPGLQSSLTNSLLALEPTDVAKSSGGHVRTVADYNSTISLLAVCDVAKQISSFGRYHPRTAVSISNLGLLYHDTKDYRSSLSVYTELLRIEQYIYGQDSFEVARTMHTIGFIIHKLGENDDKALHFLQSSLRLHLQSFEPNRNFEISKCLFNIGYVQMTKGNDNEAICFLKASLCVRRLQPSTNNARLVITALLHIRNIYQRSGDLLNASENLIEAVETAKSLPHGSNYMIFIALTLIQVGHLYLQVGDTARMMPAFSEALRLFAQVGGGIVNIDVCGLHLYCISKQHPECAALA